MKKVIVTLASVALAGAVNFGVASAHPNYDPTPPPTAAPTVGKPTTPGALQGSEVDEEQQGDKQSGDMTESGDKTEDAAGKSTETKENDAQDPLGQQGQNDMNTAQDGEFEGDH